MFGYKQRCPQPSTSHATSLSSLKKIPQHNLYYLVSTVSVIQSLLLHTCYTVASSRRVRANAGNWPNPVHDWSWDQHKSNEKLEIIRAYRAATRTCPWEACYVWICVNKTLLSFYFGSVKNIALTCLIFHTLFTWKIYLHIAAPQTPTFSSCRRHWLHIFSLD